AGRLLAQALSLAPPARPDLPRPLPLPAVPRTLAAVHPQGPDGRLARALCRGDGARLVERRPLHRRLLRRRPWGMAGDGRAQRTVADPASAAPRARDRPLGREIPAVTARGRHVR